MYATAVLLSVFLPMLLEARRAVRNERAQLVRGGVEAQGDVYRIMQVAYPGAFLAMIVEGALRGAPNLTVAAVGAGLFLAGKLLKWWAILSLGPAWTFRVIVVPGATRVTTGPYRYVAHPNYVGVIGELVGTMLLTNAWIAGPIATAGFGLLILRRVAVERRALDAILARP